MQTTIEINGKPVQITLTKDQIEEVMQQAAKPESQIMYEDACKALDREPLTLEDFSPKMSKEDRQAFLSLYKITTVIKAAKEGTKLDYSNENQEKRYPWFKWAPGSGFSLSDVGYDDTDTRVGARLSSKNVTDAQKIANAMIEDYNNWMTE